MLFEDSLFVYPLGKQNFDKFWGTQSENFRFGMPTLLLTRHFQSVDFSNYYNRI